MNKKILMPIALMVLVLGSVLVSAESNKNCIPEQSLYFFSGINTVNFDGEVYEINATSPRAREIKIILEGKEYLGSQYGSIILEDGVEIKFGALFGGGGVAAGVEFCMQRLNLEGENESSQIKDSIQDENIFGKILTWFRRLFGRD